MSITELKAVIGNWATSLGLAADHEWNKAAESLSAFVEGKQKEADAVQLLQSKGYTITPPSVQS